MHDQLLEESEKTELRAHLERLGETRCAAALTISRLTLVRAVAGLRIQRGTMFLLRSQLSGMVAT
jgi:hypothetical protein